MIGARVEIRRYVDDSDPGWVEFWLTDADGVAWSFVEKVPVVSAEDLDTNTCYPVAAVIACRVIERRVGADGKEVVVIDMEDPWGIESTTGQTRFVVRPEQLQEFDWGGE
jgi:hypothetical protein